MGSSESYTNLSGWSETIAGVLLLFRRTRTLGALATAGVMLNVFTIDVDTFVLNGDTIPHLLTDTLRWKKGFMDLPEFGGNLSWGIKMMNDDLMYYSAEIDSLKNQLILKPFGDTVNIYPLDYHFEGENLSLKGVLKSDIIQITTTYFNPDDFIIRNRGFHWVSEVPFNRRVPYRN